MVEFSDGDFELSNEIQQDFVINRGPGYSSEIPRHIQKNNMLYQYTIFPDG